MRRAVTLAAIVFACSNVTLAQSPNATVSGRVTDPAKSIISNVAIFVVNSGTGIIYKGQTNETGSYFVTDLPPGTYRMELEKPGFKTVIKPDILLHVQDALEVNFEMALGSVSQTVTVEAGAPSVQLTTSSISDVVTSTTVRELPLNGRSWTDLATLQPGVNVIENQVSFAVNADRGIRGFGTQATLSGERPQQNNYRLDGISMNDYANGAPGSVIGGNLGVDAIQEFSVITSNVPADYGKTSGGVINAVTRAGTNNFHGSGYEFLRNSALDARNFFDLGAIPPFKRNQFGVSAGGPIRKNKTFIFGDYEGLRQNKGISTVSTVPSADARNGHLSSADVTVDPSVQKYLGFWPLPNAGLVGNGDTGRFIFAGQQVVRENFVVTRVDHKFSENDSLFGTYMFDRTPFSAPDNMNNALDGNLTVRQLFILDEAHVFSPTLVNSFRLGFNRDRVDANANVTAINPAAADPSLAAVPGRHAAQVSVGGLTSFNGGLGAVTTELFRWNSYQFYDDASFNRGAHFLKFGASVERMQLNMLANVNPAGVFNFGSLTKFLMNQPSKFTSAFPSTLSPRNLRQSVISAYVEDDWRWRPKITFNIGLRYEMATVPTEIHGKLSNLYNITDVTPHLGDPYFSNPTLRNFEPRVGFAWDPFGNGKTALRGGFGVFDVLPLPYQFIIMGSTAAPFYEQGAISGKDLPPNSFFSGAFPLLGPNSLRGAHIDPNPRRNYVLQWNLNIQRELLPNLTAMIGYIGARGVHQPFRVDDADSVIPISTPQGYLWPSPVGSGDKINTHWGRIPAVFYEANSFYDALELQITKTMSHGVQIQGAFTWGKSIDTNSSSVSGDAFGNSISSLPWFNNRISRGPSDFNVGRTLVINGIWNIPAPRSLTGFAARVASGWQIGGIFKAQSGIPFTPTFGTDGDPLGQNSSDTWDVPDRSNGPGCKSLVNPGNPNNYIKTQCFAIPSAPSAAFYAANCDPTQGVFPQCFNLRGNAGRNILSGPGLEEFDFSVFKNNYIRRISENFNVQFRAEIFNLFNHANFAPPTLPDNTDIFDSTGAPTGVAGLLSSTVTTAREIQFALKIIW